MYLFSFATVVAISIVWVVAEVRPSPVPVKLKFTTPANVLFDSKREDVAAIKSPLRFTVVIIVLLIATPVLNVPEFIWISPSTFNVKSPPPFSLNIPEPFFIKFLFIVKDAVPAVERVATSPVDVTFTIISPPKVTFPPLIVKFLSDELLIIKFPLVNVYVPLGKTPVQFVEATENIVGCIIKFPNLAPVTVFVEIMLSALKSKISGLL